MRCVALCAGTISPRSERAQVPQRTTQHFSPASRVVGNTVVLAGGTNTRRDLAQTIGCKAWEQVVFDLSIEGTA